MAGWRSSNPGTGSLGCPWIDFSAPDALEQLARETIDEILGSLSVEERLQGISPQERLKGISSEELRNRLTPEERIKGIPPRRAARRNLNG